MSSCLAHMTHLFSFIGVVVAQQVQQAVHDEQVEFLFEGMPKVLGLGHGAGIGDDHIAQVSLGFGRDDKGRISS